MVELLGAANNTPCKVADTAIAAPEPSRVIAKLVIPFRKRMRPGPQLIAAGPQIPGFGNQFDTAQHRVLPDRIQKPTIGVKPIRLARQHRGQIKPKPVHMHHLHPIAQRIHHHAQHHRMRDIQRVPGAGVIDVIAFVVLQAIIAGIVQPAKADRRTQVIAFAGMVVNHVQDHFDPGRMQPPHHVLKFCNVAARHQPWVRREKADALIAPKVAKSNVMQEPLIGIGLHRQQLNACNTQLGQMIQNRRTCHAREPAPLRFGHAGMRSGQAFDIGLVDHGFTGWNVWSVRFCPIGNRIDDNGFGHGKSTVARVRHIARAIAIKHVMP